ncbi:MAG: hypothetical protein P8M79_10220, partial [Alphaproteobacteria bacterium]|nr:hypothetical protein [Alphaproteobacteria bacterium]
GFYQRNLDANAEDVGFPWVTAHEGSILREGAESFAAYGVVSGSRRYAPLLLLVRDDYVLDSRARLNPPRGRHMDCS